MRWLALLLFVSCASGTTVPIETPENIVFATVTIENQQLSFVFDTGSTRMLIDRAVAEKLGMELADGSSAQGAGAGRVALQAVAQPVDMRVGELDSRAHHFEALDLSGVSQLIGKRVDGLAGYEFFARHVVRIDYERKQMTTWKSGEAPPVAGTRVPLEIAKKWPFIRATIAGEGVPAREDRFLIDSGSGDMLDHPLVKELTNVREVRAGQGLGSAVTGWLGKATEFRVGPYAFRDLDVVCCGALEAAWRMVGGDFLSFFTTTYDYANGALFLEPNARGRAAMGGV